ncbi:MAG TPA: hypothetical protein VE862_11435 [Candidatus Acidoferrum sp.]|nr:hypothetical protein [Candidatus Acidoferrum sp.]
MLKKEIRILGLATTDLRRERRLVGIIFRGNLWLDGILTCSFDTHTDYISDIAQTILKSRQYSQIRVIISRETLLPKGIQDLRKLNIKTHLPTISIKSHSQSTTTKSRPRCLRIHRGRRKIILHTLELDKEFACEIFLVGCRGNSLTPEALRIAELITATLKKPF